MNEARTHASGQGADESRTLRQHASRSDPGRIRSMEEVHAHRGVLLRLAYRFCWNLDDAEDAVQNALLLASQKQIQIIERHKLWSWVRSIVVRQCHDIRRRAEREKKRWAMLQQNAQAVAGRSADASVEGAESKDTLMRLIAALPARQQTALVLRHLEELPYDEIAEMMSVAESSARVLVRNAREALRRAIEAGRSHGAIDSNADKATDDRGL